jgi:tRNA threonylcarbamoyladenosine biosynthesis protein TsaE
MSGKMPNIEIGKIEVSSPEQTMQIARRLGESMQGGETVALIGDLGAGKTLFCKGLAEGLGIDEIITSPTFLLVRTYDGRISMNHFDFYRLTALSDLDTFGFDEYFTPDAVCAVEWADRFPEALPIPHLEIEITRRDDQRRLLTFRRKGANLAEALENALSAACQSV